MRRKQKPKPSRTAFEWFVLNDSGGLLEPDNWPEWNEWRHTPGNRAQYVDILRLIDQLRKMPAPAEVSREELMEDAAKDPLTEVSVTTFLDGLSRFHGHGS